MRVFGPRLWGNTSPHAKRGPFLRPLCHSEEHFANRKLSLERGGWWRTGQPSASAYTPLYSPLLTLHTMAQALPHQSKCWQFTQFLRRSPPPDLAVPASAPSVSLSFLRSAPIHPRCQHSISLTQLGCQNEWQRWPPGTCCFINTTDCSVLLCGLCHGWNMFFFNAP